ncbi:glycosyltransferase family 4 protein [Algoriphagus limi]|uniref:Glycosyltransferase n=1 Tax=Algoriphagus limi TaxID=2975273 RepID=A0ABT2G145_9BACT|nr:glycosyltransferase [Algoriphagus limi]MCS5488983.1 glycosyltransferase [Algoriphagus limi]
MKLLVIGHVVHKYHNQKYFGYGPYVKEMNLWFKGANQVTVVAPLTFGKGPDPIDLPYQHSNLTLITVPEFSINSPKSIFLSLLKLPNIFFKVWMQMKDADHIHLRCPGNMGLVGTIVQIFFPSKIKTAKYAGNWDPQSNQPFSYRLQQKILSNPSLTKNMQVLVYGEWPNQSNNIYPFFTASYSESEKLDLSPRELSIKKKIKLLFVGGLNGGKQPVLSVKVLKSLIDKDIDAQLDYFGEGPERTTIEEFIIKNKLSHRVKIHGNQPADKVKEAYKNAHFLIFISKSEGWPKVVAEAMFWGCLPITSPVSCVPQMLGYGQRGELVGDDLEGISNKLEFLINSPDLYSEKVMKACEWSRQFTLERFEEEISALLARQEN